MTALELKAEIMSLIGECTCSDDYTRRKKKDPSCHYHDYKDSIEDVFRRYQGQGREWVKVEDWLPESIGSYLCFWENCHIGMLFYNSNGDWCDMWEQKKHTPTHWMPLPPPPFTETEGQE